MKALILALLLIAQSYYIEANGNHIRIHNNTDYPIKCFIYYSTGDSSSLYLRPGQVTGWIHSTYIAGVECY